MLELLSLVKCPSLTEAEFLAGINHLHSLHYLFVSDCIFISKKALERLPDVLPLKYFEFNGAIHYVKVDSPAKRESVDIALTQRMQELAPFDERYKYSKEDLMEMQEAACGVRLDRNGPLAKLLTELELLQ